MRRDAPGRFARIGAIELLVAIAKQPNLVDAQGRRSRPQFRLSHTPERLATRMG